MLERRLERAYQNLGPRYLQRAVVGQLQLIHPLLIAAICALGLYVDLDSPEFLLLIVTAVGGMAAYNVLYARASRRYLDPVRRWLEGDRSPEATVEAWTTCASFPREMMRREWTGFLGAVGYIGLLIWSAFAIWVLDLPWWALIPFACGVGVFVLYAQALRFFALEQVLRPVLADIAREATGETDLFAPALPLRVRLLAALPAINVITAVPVAGIFQSGNDIADLGLAVLISAVVAATVSLALTLLLADSVTAPLGRLTEATRRLGAGDFSVRVPVTTTDETGELASSFNQMAAGLEERERIRDAFGTYVDQEVAEHILREGTDLGGEEVEVTMMFIDVRDFTGFAERSSAPEVVATINRLFERAVPIIHEHKGHVDKFVGDGLLAVFGAPRRQENHADQALAAACEIAEAVGDEFGSELEIGIGLNSGSVVAGNVGGAGRLEFSVIGDAVNTAARVESATRKTGDTVLIAERTKELLRGSDVPLAERSGVALKGKRQEVRLFAPQFEQAPERAGSG
jgi:class 3 adenylate cyclase